MVDEQQHLQQAACQQQEQQIASNPPDQQAQQSERRRKRSRWGAETEAGLQVLASDAAQPSHAAPGGAEQPAAADSGSAAAADGGGAGADDAAGRKKRRSRWGPETENTTAPGAAALVQGLQITLPPSIAALVDMHVDPRVTELQRQLNIVSVWLVCVDRLVGVIWMDRSQQQHTQLVLSVLASDALARSTPPPTVMPARIECT